ncbi:phospholipase A-2-activating protein [Pelomyxa schiedti]|nr:phospholipase A-2-activating protein [Pelomyxa schiedti]
MNTHVGDILEYFESHRRSILFNKMQLSCELSGHTGDVRCVTASPTMLFTGSRDHSIKVWQMLAENTENPQYTLLTTLNGHTNAVGALMFDPFSGHLVSAGYDNAVILWDLQKFDIAGTLTGHEELLLWPFSGSWDNTARVWNGTECQFVLSGHTASVWAVLALPNGLIVTGSADKSIKLWNGATCTKTELHHTDCVRGLCLVPEIGFLSCSNDCNVCLWTIDGSCIGTYPAHAGFIYSICYLPLTAEYATVSEDRNLKIWKGSTEVDTVTHPSTVWGVFSLPNGDIVTGASDGNARIWTRDPRRIASEGVRQAYAATLQSTQAQTAESINVSALPGLSVLSAPGKFDGEPKVVRNGNVAEAYNWNEASHKWVLIGEVVNQDSAASSGVHSRVMYKGKEYDYVFDVDLDGRKFKLAYNNNENPYIVAHNFLADNDLEQTFMEDIVRFIDQNTQDVVIGEEEPRNLAPLPFTGDVRYTGPENKFGPRLSAAVPPHNPFVEPLPTAKPKLIPYTTTVCFQSPNYEGLERTLMKFSDAISFPMSLSPSEKISVTNLLVALKSNNVQLGPTDVQLLQKLLSWPVQNVLPGRSHFYPQEPTMYLVVDLFGQLVLHPAACQPLALNWTGEDIVSKILNYCQSSSTDNLRMLCVRFIANALVTGHLQPMFDAHKSTALELFAELSKSHNEHLRFAIVSAILNLAVKMPAIIEKAQCISILCEVLVTDERVNILGRTVLALGTLVTNDPLHLEVLRSLDTSQRLTTLSTSTPEQTLAQCAIALLNILKS